MQMKVVSFCGGLGMIIREASESVPRHMVHAGRPILWHVMKYHVHFAHEDFILCLGYRAHSSTTTSSCPTILLEKEDVFPANYSNNLTDFHLPLNAARTMRILRTGDKGYIGAVMVPLLILEGHTVTGLNSDWFEQSAFSELPGKIVSRKKDLCDLKPSDLERFDAVIHLAGTVQ